MKTNGPFERELDPDVIVTAKGEVHFPNGQPEIKSLDEFKQKIASMNSESLLDLYRLWHEPE